MLEFLEHSGVHWDCRLPTDMRRCLVGGLLLVKGDKALLLFVLTVLAIPSIFLYLVSVSQPTVSSVFRGVNGPWVPASGSPSPASSKSCPADLSPLAPRPLPTLGFMASKKLPPLAVLSSPSSPGPRSPIDPTESLSERLKSSAVLDRGACSSSARFFGGVAPILALFASAESRNLFHASSRALSFCRSLQGYCHEELAKVTIETSVTKNPHLSLLFEVVCAHVEEIWVDLHKEFKCVVDEAMDRSEMKRVSL